MRRIKTNGKFCARLIDRNKPIEFYLNGLKIKALKGDSVLSALLAANIEQAGKYFDFPIVLDEYLALPVTYLGKNGEKKIITTIEKMPAINGAKYFIKGMKGQTLSSKFIKKLTKGEEKSLNIDLFNYDFSIGRNFANNKKQILEVELLIIGAGLAGLSAANYAGKFCKKILLLEQREIYGGDAVLFGASAQEGKPEQLIENLIEKIKKQKNIDIRNNCTVLDINNNSALVQQIKKKNDELDEEFFVIKAQKIIIATGCRDKIALFHGNRLPNIIGLNSAFRLFYQYGLFPAEKIMIFCNNNFAYRLALLAENEGAKIDKIIDNRIEPHSRFIEFSKSCGIKFATGVEIREISKTKNNRLKILSNFSFEEFAGKKDKFEQYETDNIIISFGFLPNLELWRSVGGEIYLAAKETNIEILPAKKRVKNIALAGSNAGYKSHLSTMQSGIEAVNYLFGKKKNKIIEQEIDPIFESPMGGVAISDYRPINGAGKYLDFTNSLALIRAKEKKSIFTNLAKNKFNSEIDLLNLRALSVGDIFSLFLISFIGQDLFTQLIKERALVNSEKRIKFIKQKKKEQKKEKKLELVPNYLIDRFAKKQIICEIKSLEGEIFAIGQLIFVNSDINDPEKAIGVILAKNKASYLALIAKDSAIIMRQVSVNYARGHSPAIIIDKHNPSRK